MSEDFLNGKVTLGAGNISAEDCFLALSEEETKELQNYRTEVNFEKGETILKTGFVASSLIYIEEGLARLDILNDGKVSTVCLVPEHSFIGIICTFANRNLDFSSVALEKTRVSLIDIRFFEKMLRQNGEFAYLLIRHMSWLTNHLIHYITRNAQKNIEGALAILLLDFADIYKSDTYTVPANRKDLANILGYSKESVINTLSKFNKDGLIEVKGHEIKIINRKMLKHICELG